MRYEVLMGVNDDKDLTWARTFTVEADDELTAAFRAGAHSVIHSDRRWDEPPIEVLAIRSEKDTQ